MKTGHLLAIIITCLILLVLWFVYPFYIPPSPPAPETSLLIDKAMNRLYFYKDGYLKNIYPVATGKDPDLTPEGKFTIVVKEANPEGLGKEAILGTRWLGLNVPGHEDGLKYGIHGTNEPSSIGHHASAGCIRMANSDIEDLYPNIPLKTTVLIVQGSCIRVSSLNFITEIIASINESLSNGILFRAK